MSCRFSATVAQLVEQLIRNQQVAGSSPASSSQEDIGTFSGVFFCFLGNCVAFPRKQKTLRMDRTAAELFYNSFT